MGDAGVFLLIVMLVLTGFVSLLLGWMGYKIYEFKKDVNRFETDYALVYALEEAVKKLNKALRSNDRRLNRYLHEISDIKDRIDILEAGHPDSDFDYATVDDNDEVVELWFDGKKYILENKPDEDTMKLYADNKVVAETTRPEEKRCCATCHHYQPESGFSTCDLRTWLHTTKKYATMADSACDNYEKVYSATKGEVDYPYVQYKNMSGNGPAEQMAKRVDELQCEIQRLNMIAQFGCTAQELRQRLEELMRNDF